MSSGGNSDIPPRSRRYRSSAADGGGDGDGAGEEEGEDDGSRGVGGGGGGGDVSTPPSATGTRQARPRKSRSSGLVGGPSRRSGSGGSDVIMISSSSMSSSSSLTHDDELERIREMRARRLRNEGRQVSVSSVRSATGEDGNNNSSNSNNNQNYQEGGGTSSLLERRLRERRNLSSGTTSSSRPSSNLSIVSTGSSTASVGGGSGPPSRMKGTPMISRRELEEAGLVRSSRDMNHHGSTAKPESFSSRGSGGRASSTGGLLYNNDNTNNDGDDDDQSASSSVFARVRRERLDRIRGDASADDDPSTYSRARRERLAAAAALPLEEGTNNDHEATGGGGGWGGGRDRDFRQRSDIEARLAARRISRERMEKSTSNIPQFSMEEGRIKRREGDDARPPRRSSMSGMSQTSSSTSTKGAIESHGSVAISAYKEHRQRPMRSNTGDELQHSFRERLHEGSKRPTPQRAKSAHLDLMGGDIPPTEKETVCVDSLEDREARKVERLSQAARAKSAGDVIDVAQGDNIDSLEDGEFEGLEPQRRHERTTSTDLSTRLRERREARAAEREARERGKKEMTNLDSFRRRSRTATDDVVPPAKSDSDASMSMDGPSPSKRAPQLHDLEISDDEVESDASPGWSIRLCVISAVDLPLNVVPNIPLCPVLKMGLVKLPHNGTVETEKTATSAVLEKLGNCGIEAVGTAKVRTTTSKVLSKRDNGCADFHQEYRWDRVKHPMSVGLCIELCARAVQTPTNFRESPPPLSQSEKGVQPSRSNSDAASAESLDQVSQSSRNTDSQGEPIRSLSRSSSGTGPAGTTTPSGSSRGFWGRNTNRKQAELEAAKAAAAVARMLVDQDGNGGNGEPPSLHADQLNSVSMSSLRIPRGDGPDMDVALKPALLGDTTATEMTEDVRLGSLVVPLTNLPLDKANGSEAARLEQWYELETVVELTGPAKRRKKPRVLVEISFSSPEVLDDSEDELEDETGDDDEMETLNGSSSALHSPVSFSRRSMMEARGQLKEKEKPQEERKVEDPVLEPGVIDFVAVVGCGDIGDQRKDDGMKGWVNTTPDCRLLEQFPPSNEFHTKLGRIALLPEMVQWFCFPEGARLWRGTGPPSHSDLNLKRFSASSPVNIASSIAAFDACLDCTTSFSWFVIASNSDEYGSSLVKTYGAVIRFFVPAPAGIDPKQDDFAQALMGNSPISSTSANLKRLWVPIGICLTSNLPIIGVMESLLLQLCEELSTMPGGVQSAQKEEIHKALANMILNFQKPIAGAVNCSIPFISGDRFLLSLPPRTGLPPLPHGRAVVSVCRLLGAEGLNFLMAAVLTEDKILVHSQDISDIAMVAEVITALIYPFVWSLPYIPVLPLGMLEFVEAPMPYVLGIPTCNLQLVDPRALDDVVVIDLDNGFAPVDFFHGQRQSTAGGGKQPNSLPTPIAKNISNAVYKLLRAEEEMDEEFGESDLGTQSLPRLEGESLAERQFRVSVAIEICGLLRGYQECVGHVFNRDKFLKISPVIYEEKEKRAIGTGIGSGAGYSSQKVISARSKRFMSNLVNGQNLQQLLETLESDDASFFHEVMELIDESSSDTKGPKRVSSGDHASNKAEKIVAQLVQSLQQVEDKIPTYRVEKGEGIDPEDDDGFIDGDSDFDDFDAFHDIVDILPPEDRNFSSFTSTILSPIKVDPQPTESDSNMQAVSMEYLAKIVTTPWEYNSFFQIQVDNSVETPMVHVNEKVKLRDAIGERRFRSWKLAQDKKTGGDTNLAFLSESATSHKQDTALDLTSLITSATSDMSDTSSISSGMSQLRMSSLSPEEQRVSDAKNRDIIRRCLDKAQGGGSRSDPDNPFKENGRDLMAESEKALRNPKAQRFLLSILAQRSRLENKKARSMRRQSAIGNTASRLDPMAFDCMVRLICAALDSCMEYKEYEIAYRLLTQTAGFIMVVETDEGFDDDDPSRVVITMMSRVALHPIFADIGVWETVMALHLRERQSARRSDEGSEDEEGDDEVEYEAAVATLYEMVGYGIPGEELSRFAMRASEENGWFCDDRGRQLLLLARRISVRRDQTDIGGTGEAGDLDMMRKAPEGGEGLESYIGGVQTIDDDAYKWKEVGWCHPAAPPSRQSNKAQGPTSSSVDQYMKRSAVTALASFGSSIVVSGGLDGGVFLAHSIQDGTNGNGDTPSVRGIHLDWGSASRAGAGSSSDGEYGVGAVSCLAAAQGGGHHVPLPGTATKDVGGTVDEGDLVNFMEGSRVVAGTTAGDLRVWSVKEIYSAILMARKGGGTDSGNTASRLKFSLRGRALSGHRGGVTCIEVPSQVYRADSLVTGGADGLIKLWSLRAPTGTRRTAGGPSDSESGGGHQRGRGGDALSTLEGHNGRIQCIQTAWHGDHLLSGSSDRTICVWDLAASSEKSKCIHRLFGHFGWVTKVQYWGPNTIVSASTDRSVALWDARVRSTPLFMLRHHHAPISDLLVGSRTDPYMITAAADGIATWDVRTLSDAQEEGRFHVQSHGGTGGGARNNASRGKPVRTCKIVRQPSAAMRLYDMETHWRQKLAAGSVYLARGVREPFNSFISVGSDAILRTWDASSGALLDESRTGHCDAISSFSSFAHHPNDGFSPSGTAATDGEQIPSAMDKGTLTSCLDGTIRMRKLIQNIDH